MKFKLFTAFIALGFLTIFIISSCEKSNESCTCTETLDDGTQYKETIAPSSFGASNCSDLALKLRMESPVSDAWYECR